MPPLRPPATAPVPAPTLPSATGAPRRGAGRGLGRLAAERGARAGPPVAAAAEVEEGGGGYDRHDLGRVRADPEAAARVLQPGHDAGGGVQAEGAAAGEDDGFHALDQIAGVEGIGLAGARAAAAHVHGGGGAAGVREDHGGAGQGPLPGQLRMPDAQTADVGERVQGARGERCVGHTPILPAEPVQASYGLLRAANVTPVATVTTPTSPVSNTVSRPAKVHARIASAETGRTNCWATPRL
ncbi:hypothetical protein GCM10020000_47220 [Streptomyces olivoverticillatus]